MNARSLTPATEPADADPVNAVVPEPIALFQVQGVPCAVVAAASITQPGTSAPGNRGSQEVRAEVQVFGELRVGRDAYLVIRQDTAVTPARPQPALLTGQAFAGPAPASPTATPACERPSISNLLTPRELQIALHVARGRYNKQIAHDIQISEWTVSSHLRRIFAKLGVRTRAEMVARVLSEMG